MAEASTLREGYSTGTTACAAALAALHKLLGLAEAPAAAVPLPPFEASGNGPIRPRAWLDIPIESTGPGPAPDILEALGQEPFAWLGQDLSRASAGSHAQARKYAGDDPDVTDGALISATLLRFDTQPENSRNYLPLAPESTKHICAGLEIAGGPGIGRVSLAGLGLEPGQAAINPVPLAQIRFALGHELERIQGRTSFAQCRPFWLSLILSVKDGAKIALKTMNPRLGILGGISILGTQGTVRPFSHEAWRASILKALEVARASGQSWVCLSSGRRSERLLQQRYPELAPQAFIQAADFAQFSLEAAGKGPFENIVWGAFFAKLLKLAQGQGSTHVSQGTLSLSPLAELAWDLGLGCSQEIENSLTAAQALEYILADANGKLVLETILKQAKAKATEYAGRPVRVHLFHLDGRELGRQ